ncbi:MAG: Na(+)-translocating NADH-quinone reductase subunit A [Bacteroidales bacterium]|nr:Na(+)-translocating NADH-quinone reductase subunit A [Bacteroidales bacterium]
MSEVIKIRKGLDIKLVGQAEKKISEVKSDTYALKPPDFVGVFPKMFLKEGDPVKAGTPVFFDKYRDNIVFSSPVSGTIKEIHRGAKRKMLEVRIDSNGKMEYEDYGAADPLSLDRKQVIEKLMKSGVWANIRQRPYSVIANPESEPKAIHISAFDTAPLGPDMDFLVEQDAKAFQAGINALTKLTNGKVHLNVREGQTQSRVFLDAKGVQVNRFNGPHPTGNVGVQIHHLDPVNKGDVVWYLTPVAVIFVGRLFLTGTYDVTRLISFCGSEVKDPQYLKVITGTAIAPIIKDRIKESNIRYISGNVLTGDQIDKNGYLGFYHDQLTVIPEGNEYEMFGWAMPRFNKFSYSKTYFSWLLPKKRYDLDTNMNGGHRAFVLTGEYERVFPMDIYPLQLLKAIIVKDIDLMENLGIYEVDEEDFALCEFIDASKTEMQVIVREGLDFIRKEMQ